MNKEEKQIDLISCKRRYQGVGFIKSRKSKFAVMDMAEDMIKMACANSIVYSIKYSESLLLEIEVGSLFTCKMKVTVNLNVHTEISIGI